MALRLRAVLGDLRQEYPEQRVLLVAHEAVIFLLRYIIEELSQEQLLELVEATTLGNASLTSWQLGVGRLRLAAFNWVDHLRLHGVESTQQETVGSRGRSMRHSGGA